MVIKNIFELEQKNNNEILVIKLQNMNSQSWSCLRTLIWSCFCYHRKVCETQKAEHLLFWFIRDVSGTCLSNRAKTVCVSVRFLHKSMCLLRSLAHSAEDMSGCVFRSLLSLRVLMCVLFLRDVWTVSHSCQTHPRMNGRLGSHSLNQPPVACACVDVC